MDIGKYYKSFFEYLKNVRKLSPQSVKTYSIALNLLKENYEIEKRENGYILNITAFRLAIKGLSKRSISTKLSAVRTFIKYLKQFHNINIVLKGNQSIKVPKTLPKPIKHQKITEALKNCSLEERLMVLIIYALGVRVSEVANLKVKDISNNWIRITGKGDKTREIPVLKNISLLIQEYLQNRKNNTYLFQKGDKPLSSSQIRYRIDKIFKRAGVKVTPHQLRHSFATELLNSGARISDVSELLGHSSMSTTQIYTKLNSSAKMENYLKAHPLANLN